MMRIITGRARGVRLDTLSGEMTRPTLERTKEAVFSMLQFEIRDARVLDLFAGSGQLGLEAVSRGASGAVFCDRAKEAIEIVKRNIQKTRLAELCEVYCADYTSFLRTLQGKAPFDIVFLDPPYAIGAVPTALRALNDYHLLANGAKVVCETGNAADVFGGDATLENCFDVVKQARYGAAYVSILTPKQKEEGTV